MQEPVVAASGGVPRRIASAVDAKDPSCAGTPRLSSGTPNRAAIGRFRAAGERTTYPSATPTSETCAPRCGICGEPVRDTPAQRAAHRSGEYQRHARARRRSCSIAHAGLPFPTSSVTHFAASSTRAPRAGNFSERMHGRERHRLRRCAARRSKTSSAARMRKQKKMRRSEPDCGRAGVCTEPLDASAASGIRRASLRSFAQIDPKSACTRAPRKKIFRDGDPLPRGRSAAVVTRRAPARRARITRKCTKKQTLTFCIVHVALRRANSLQPA